VRFPPSGLVESFCLFGFVVASGVFLGSVAGVAVAAAKHREVIEVRLALLAALAAVVALGLLLSSAMLEIAKARRRARQERAAAAPATIFVGVMAGIFAATESGWGWVAAGNGLPAGSTIHSLTVGSADGSTVYARTDHGPFRSTDRGMTWHPWIEPNGDAIRARTVGGRARAARVGRPRDGDGERSISSAT
jgi:hypothetical protein